MRPHVVFRYISYTLLMCAAFLLLSALVSLVYRDSGLLPLLYSGIVTAFFGIFILLFVPAGEPITNREGFLIVTGGWVLTCLVGVMPYVLWGGEFTFVNAWFESVSGFTTTGSTILADIEALPMSLLFWRSATHWIGGIGIIIFALSVLPGMGQAGMVLYRSEISPLAADNFNYRTKTVLKILLYTYLALTLAETILLLLCGMNLFDALTHSFATIATGGFSPKNASVAYYHSIPVELVIILFMVLSGMHFGLLFMAISKKRGDIWRSTVAQYYLIAMAIGTTFVAINIHGKNFTGWGDAFRYAAFQVASIGTSTGFATTDSSIWPPLAQLILIFFTLQCACAGSTSGGIKTDRVVIMAKAVIRRIEAMVHPHAVIPVKMNKTKVNDDVIEASVLYIALYISIVFISSLILSAQGVDALSAFSGSAAVMGNVGPGLGSVGSVGNFGALPELSKYVLSADMLLGRLEIFGLLLLIMPRTWR